MIRISAVIITYNEEKNIARCIESVKPVVDEVVILDCFSQDRTREIAEAHGATFYTQQFLGFAKQKNRAVELASNDIVLSLDADEYLSSELTQSILRVKTDWKRDGYMFNRLSSFEGTWIMTCGWYPDQKLRLWDRRKGTWHGDGVHERVEMTEGATSAMLKGDLYHRAYDNISQFLQKNQNYSTIHAQVNRYRTSSSVFKILYKTIFAFFKAYILKGGVLDGYKGLVISGSTAHWVFYKYAKLLEANKTVRVSLIVESSGEIKDLERTLTFIKNQKELPAEVIVNGKLARTATKVPGIASNFPTPIRFVDSVTSNGIDEAVNIAKEEYVLVLKNPAKLSTSFLKEHRQKAWKGKIVSGVDANSVSPLNDTSEWKHILGNGTVAFWKEDWRAGLQRSLQLPTTVPVEHIDVAKETRGISVVIPNYNGVGLFPQTLPSLFVALKKCGLPYEVLIVDDCSTDDSVGMLTRDFPEVRVITSKVNQGFAPTINKGIREAVYDLVFLLNSDVKMEPDYFIYLIPYFEREDTFGVMGQIVNWEDDRIQDGAKLPTFQGAKIKTFKNFLPSETPVHEGLYTMYLSGAETLVSREKLNMLGGFDEIFAPYYIEDYELSLRAWRLGWKCYYDHRAVCRHKTSSSIKSKSRKQQVQTIYYRNKMFLHAIHLTRLQKMVYYPQIFFECLVRVLSFRFHYVRSIKLFFEGHSKTKASREKFESLAAKVGTNLSIAQVAKKIGDSLNRTSIWRF